MRPIDRFAKVHEVLLDQGRRLELALVFDLMSEEEVANLAPVHRKFARALRGVFKRNYANWYCATSALIRHVEPRAHEEFVSYFLANSKRKGIEPIAGPLRDWLSGTAPVFEQKASTKLLNGAAIVSVFFANQLRILDACHAQTKGAPVLAAR